ncbi:L-psp endoribonuclease family protein [Xylariaceae sp. FL0804]|nr:L-psp endoribonuclease family protein [Xylariaceae sp. FL0804]
MAATKVAVTSDKAPAPLPVFSQAIKYNGMVYCSGNVGKDPVTRKLAEGGVKAETKLALTHMKNVLEAGNSGLNNIVKVNVFLTTMDDFAAMNEVYVEFFEGYKPLPCRTCVAVYQLPMGAKMEIECTAFENASPKM